VLGDFKSDLIALASEAPGVVSQLVTVLKAVKPVLPTVRMVIEDPAFPRVVQQIQTLHDIEAARAAATPTVPGLPTPPGVGVGLSKAVPILDAVIYARRNPWAPWAAGAVLLLAIGGVGYRLGRRKKP
jgi:hypothetical protein